MAFNLPPELDPKSRAGLRTRMLNIAGGFGETGNIDIFNRPQIQNPDGSISTVRSQAVGFGPGNEVVMPTVFEDGVVSGDEAIDRFKQSGQFLGRFDKPDQAELFSQILHNQQAALLDPNVQALLKQR